MKVKRVKAAKQWLNKYNRALSTHHGITSEDSYDALLDGTFCRAALKFKLNIGEQLPKYLNAQCILNTTRCCITECELLGSLLYGPLSILKTFKVLKCKHKQPVPASKCVFETATRNLHLKKKALLIGTLDKALTERICGSYDAWVLPVLYISHSAIRINKINFEACSARMSVTDTKPLSIEDAELKTVRAMKAEAFAPSENSKLRRKKKKRAAKGPNPLSCKRKKK